MDSIGAVIVTHNNQATLMACLESLQKAGIEDIVVVDNASTDNTSSHIPSGITVFKNAQNIGFGAAVNQGASTLKNEYLLFLNPDAQLQDSLEEAVQAMRQDSHLGIVGLALYDKEGKLEQHSFGGFPSLRTLFLRKLFPKATAPRIARSSERRGATSPDWVSAGAMVVRQKTWQQIGGFDPIFFMYWEDIDICLRAHKAGWKITHLPQVHVVHQRGASLADTRKKTQLYDAAADRYFKKHYPRYIWGIQHFGRQLYRGLFPRVS
ncbi:MAG: glycosyltransferase family 2 protein [Candidatus Andersenbacteria bacterium]|nr:glycosyltransferase family 2 protein [Candidatus Andersenbacteria bacterium]